jgi:transposase
MGMQMQESVNKDLIIEGLVVNRNTRGRAIYNKQAVSQLVARCKEPGVSIAQAAMVNGVNANLLRKWMTKNPAKSKRKQAASAMLLPVVITSTPKATKTSVVPDVNSDTVYEIVLSKGTLRVPLIGASLGSLIALLSA